MIKKAFILSICQFFFGWANTYAQFERILQNDLSSQKLALLGDAALENRFDGIQSFLSAPAEYALPVLREALGNPQYTSIHWRIAFLLSILGTQEDMPLLLQAFPRNDVSFQEKIWVGALTRLFWRFHSPAESKVFISKPNFTSIEDHAVSDGGRLSGSLTYRIVNQGIQPILIKTDVDVWKAETVVAPRSNYHWINSGRQVTAEIPLTLKPNSETSDLRIDFKVLEVGSMKLVAHYKANLTLTNPPAINPR